ncbi:bacterial low temperature requirement A protein-domain-containing protein [Zychaea mexicana]|uniref:bacterial low temperature requirement A protein-domain-containing protein n=1 Tax=Zychaea mexicana TaxID=64656 RepID=UPI0022FDBE02|nr:bacterial low temperature requirement A protein-domain-containing protein [Zychaea mexicana]KAI9495462.1 bacterial low temperature requirement A protein-domain-containing protein [Zychaea mexicana]
MSMRRGTVRRGPTMRGRGGYRPPIGRQSIIRSNNNNNSDDDEEFMALNRADNDVEMEQIEFSDEQKSSGNRTSMSERPLYHHGDETFGDVISHPIEQLHAHRARRETFKHDMQAWRQSVPPGAPPPPEEEEDYVVVVHFRQLRGNQSFALNHEKAEVFARKIKLTPQERIKFNGVHDTDGLTAFLYKSKREFSIKIHHHKSEFSSNHHASEHFHDLSNLEHNPENYTIEFNENVYVEFKPKRHQFHDILPPEATRRPFFQHPEPDLSADIGQEKAASWLELFYDLFYIATLTEFTHNHVIKDWASLGTYTQWFIITWWAWTASSLYTARFDTDDVVHHIWKLIEMCAVIAMAGTAEHFYSSPAYVYGYIALKGVLVCEYSIVFIVALLARSKSRIALAFYIGANLISITLWAASLAILDQGTHRILWYLGILTELVVNVISRSDKALSWAASNLAERLGLLTLIVLGENLMGLIALVAKSGMNPLVVFPNFMAVVIIFGFFFMYFEDFTKEVFLVNKHHQVWVYLHFPLHLCQVAFGIALIDVLKVYRGQMIAAGVITEEEDPTESESHGTEASGTESHGATESSGTSSGDHATESSGSTSDSTEAAAHRRARRAIESVYPSLSNNNNDSDDTTTPSFDPLDSEPAKLKLDTISSSSSSSLSSSNNKQHHIGGYLTLFQYAISATALTALQALDIASSPLLSSSSTTEEPTNISSTTTNYHHFAKRAGGALDVSFTDEEKVFIYKVFLICGGLILTINSLIKMLNTKLADKFGKIIIASRIINAIVLWSMCALPFSQLDAIVLLSVMMGSLILQAIVDLLD